MEVEKDGGRGRFEGRRVHVCGCGWLIGIDGLDLNYRNGIEDTSAEKKSLAATMN